MYNNNNNNNNTFNSQKSPQYDWKNSFLQEPRSQIRPHLEFSISAWSPYYNKDKQLLERVQHRFFRMIGLPGLKQLPYQERLERLGLWSLKERRNRADLLDLESLSNVQMMVNDQFRQHVLTEQ